VKQGLFAKLVEPDEIARAAGKSATQTTASRIDEFLNRSGKPLAEAVFSPREQTLIRNFGNLMQQITPRQGVPAPSDGDHLFRLKTTSDSNRWRPPVPIDGDHRFRSMATSDSN
jgi:hypothetical protein